MREIKSRERDKGWAMLHKVNVIRDDKVLDANDERELIEDVFHLIQFYMRQEKYRHQCVTLNTLEVFVKMIAREMDRDPRCSFWTQYTKHITDFTDAAEFCSKVRSTGSSDGQCECFIP